jgi:DNA-binding NarL/FixJ family response regulator
MKNKELIRVAVAESSVILRSGITAVMKRLPDVRIQPVEILSAASLHDCMQAQSLDILIINPNFDGFFDIERFKQEYHICVIALVSSFMDNASLKKYDATISIFDDINSVAETIKNLQNIHAEESDDEHESLSTREREIVVCVVQGLTNKEIADQLCLSIHTVITHRRNISRKLQIHSSAGLTIYAIVNKLVDINDVRM